MSPAAEPPTPAADLRPLESLAATVTQHASAISSYLSQHDLPQPSLAATGPSTVLPPSAPAKVQDARQKLIAAALELAHLATGPSEYLPHLATGFHYVACVDWLCAYNVFHLVPAEGSIGYTALAEAARVPVPRLRAILRMAMTGFLFREVDGAGVAHSATSALLAASPQVYAYATHLCRKSAPVAGAMAAASQRWGAASTRKYETAYNEAFKTDLPFFDHLSRDAARMDEFARYMQNVRSSEAVNIKHLVSGFGWQELGEGKLVVDVGGSTGGAAAALAQNFPQLRYIVQDLPENADAGRALVDAQESADVASRIKFQGHDFMNPQPVEAADIYLLRMILHDWADEDAQIILRNLVTAMQPQQSRLLIMDTVLPQPGSVPVSVERISRARDMTMLQTFNSKERDLADWSELLTTVDRRLQIRSVLQPVGSAMSIMEVVLGD